MANKEQGEFEVKIGGETLIMKFSFRAIASVESAFGEPLVKRFIKLDEENPMAVLKDLVVLFKETLAAGGNEKSEDWLMDNMVLPDLKNYMAAVKAAMGLATVDDGGEDQGNANGGTTRQTGASLPEQL